MTSAEIEQYFIYHNSNMRSLNLGYGEIRKQIKNLYTSTNKLQEHLFNLADNNPEKIEIRKLEKSLSRILSGIQVSWAEESIKRLLYEKNLLTDTQRDYLIERPALDQKWYKTLKIVYCIAYDLVPSNDDLCLQVNINHQRNDLGDELVNQYFDLKRIITKHLVPNFSIRNKVQHGEWEFAFKPRFSKEYSQELTDKISHENIITTTSRYTLVNSLYQMMVDLGRFKSDSFALDSITTPFEYFYDNYIKKIDFEVEKITNPEVEHFISDIVQKNIRGIEYRNNC